MLPKAAHDDAYDFADVEAATAEAATAALPPQLGQLWVPQPRGSDGGLAKALPTEFDGKAQNYSDCK